MRLRGCPTILAVVVAVIEFGRSSVAAQPAVDFCNRENGRFVAACQATCQASCNDPTFSTKSTEILNACRQIKSKLPSQRVDSSECTRLKAEFSPEGVRPPPTDIGRLGQEAEACIGHAEKSETIESGVMGIGSAALKKEVAAFWAGRPTCIPSPQTLVDAAKCIRSGMAEISDGYSLVRNRTIGASTENRNEFCRVAKPLIEGKMYDELELVAKRVVKFDGKVKELNDCARKFRNWSNQPRERAAEAAQPASSESGPDAPPSGSDYATFTNNLYRRLETNLKDFETLSGEFVGIRANVAKTKGEITVTVADAVDLCRKARTGDR